MIENDYGKEVILDLHECDPTVFTRTDIKIFFELLCDKIDMVRCQLHFWDDLDTPACYKETEPHLVGTSAIQFIKTSNITIHTLDIMKRVYLNVFSCKDFDESIVKDFSEQYFKGKSVNTIVVRRV